MENSVNALQIAGGLLIAVMLITLIVFVFRSVSSMENQLNLTKNFLLLIKHQCMVLM